MEEVIFRQRLENPAASRREEMALRQAHVAGANLSLHISIV